MTAEKMLNNHFFSRSDPEFDFDTIAQIMEDYAEIKLQVKQKEIDEMIGIMDDCQAQINGYFDMIRK